MTAKPDAGASASGPGLLYFPGAGKQRNPALSAQSRHRRAVACETAAMLGRGGVPDAEIHTSSASDTLIDLATEGQLREALGCPRRRWAGFHDQAQQRCAQWGREYGAFSEEGGITDVIQVVVRAPNSLVRINALRVAHSLQSAQLSDRLRYGRRTLAPNFACDMIAAEIVAASPDGDVLDLHFHLAVRATDDELANMRRHFEKAGWSWWDAVSASSPEQHRNPESLAHYIAKGLAHALSRSADVSRAFTPENIATLFYQTRGLAMVRATGEFRTWKAELERDGLMVGVDRHGRPKLQPRRIAVTVRHFRKHLLAGSSVQLLRMCVHDFGDGIKRPAILVRGKVDVTFAEVAAAYDLSHATASARHAIPVLLKNTSKPEYGLGSVEMAGEPLPGGEKEAAISGNGEAEGMVITRRGQALDENCHGTEISGGCDTPDAQNCNKPALTEIAWTTKRK